jgi:hypothetical protein
MSNLNSKYQKYINTFINNLLILDVLKIGKRTVFKIQCICKNIYFPRAGDVLNNKSKSCGCKKAEFVSTANTLPEDTGLVNEIYKRYKSNAKKRNLEFNFNKEEFRKFLFADCFYCGVNPLPGRIRKKDYCHKEKILNYNGIDRIDSSKSYSIDNCVTCCKICNLAKQAMTIAEFKNWIHLLLINNGYHKL